MFNTRIASNRLILSACALVIAFAAALTWSSSAFAVSQSEIDSAYQKTETVIAKSAEADFGDEWNAFCLARANASKHTTYLTNYLKAIDKHVAGAEGKLSSTKSTEYSRTIIAVTAAGKKATNVGGYNLIEALSDQTFVEKQGVNGPMYALLALDTKNYSIPALPSGSGSDAKQTTRDALIDTILESQLDDGSWSWPGSESDIDLTATALQALTPHRDHSKVRNAINKGVDWLSEAQENTGDFGSSESTAQVIVALCGLGINPAGKDFTKEGKTVLDGLMLYAVTNGGFAHIINGSKNAMATEQGFYALVAYKRYQANKPALYNMSDAAALSPSSSAAAPSTSTKPADAASNSTTSKTDSSKDKGTTSTKKSTKSTKSKNKGTSKSGSTANSSNPPASNPRNLIPPMNDSDEPDDEGDDLEDEGDDEDDDEDLPDGKDPDDDDDEDEDGDDPEDLDDEDFAAFMNNDRPYWGQLPTGSTEELTAAPAPQTDSHQLLVKLGAVLATLAGAALVALLGRAWQLRCERRNAK